MTARRHFLRPILASPDAACRLLNASRGLVVASRILPAFDSASRRKGLLGRPGLPESDALIIGPCNAVHTFRMQFAIDLLFVNRDGEVLKRLIAVPRNRIAVCLRAFAVIECTAHHPGVAQTSVGDVLVPEANEPLPTSDPGDTRSPTSWWAKARASCPAAVRR